VTCYYFWQYDLWLSHYWSCDRYNVAILIPPKNKMAAFIAWISKSMICHFQIVIMDSVQILSRVFENGIWWFSNKLAALREKSYTYIIIKQLITLCNPWPVTHGYLTSAVGLGQVSLPLVTGLGSTFPAIDLTKSH